MQQGSLTARLSFYPVRVLDVWPAFSIQVVILSNLILAVTSPPSLSIDPAKRFWCLIQSYSTDIAIIALPTVGLSVSALMPSCLVQQYGATFAQLDLVLALSSENLPTSSVLQWRAVISGSLSHFGNGFTFEHQCLPACCYFSSVHLCHFESSKFSYGTSGLWLWCSI